jgi:hypothetical protein
MATTARGQKTAFLRDLFRDNPKVNYKAANEAWKEAGNDGDLSSNTFYNAKTALKKEAGTGTTEVETPSPTTRPKAQPARSTRAKSTTRKTSAPKNGQPNVPEPPRSHEKSSLGDRDRVFDEVEAGIDDLIFRLKLAGGAPEVEAKLREVRRSLHPSVR